MLNNATFCSSLRSHAIPPAMNDDADKSSAVAVSKHNNENEIVLASSSNRRIDTLERKRIRGTQQVNTLCFAIFLFYGLIVHLFYFCLDTQTRSVCL